MNQVPPIRYAKTDDGINIAYYTFGHGPPVIMLLPNPHLTMAWAVPSLRTFSQRLASHMTLINLDCRGSGLSDRNVSAIDAATFIADVSAVISRLKYKKVSLFGLGTAAPIALALAGQCPEVVERLVLLEASLGDSEINRAIDGLKNIDRRLVAETRAAHVVGLTDPENAQAYADLQKATRDEFAVNLYKQWLATFDIEGTCSSIRAPSLFIHAAGDEIFPLSGAQAMVAAIPSAKLHVIAGDSGFSLRRDESVVQLIIAHLSSIDGFPRSEQGSFGTENAAETATGSLSKREREVLPLIAKGLTNQQIAATLGVSASTVSHHVTNILTKTGAVNRTEAAAYAHRLRVG